MLAGVEEKIKQLLGGNMYLVLIVVLVGIASFGLGRLSATSEESERVVLTDVFPTTTIASAPLPEVAEDTQSDVIKTQGLYVGSVNSDKYHLPWCSGALRIKEENKIWFPSKEEAEAAGYSPASNCPGIE